MARRVRKHMLTKNMFVLSGYLSVTHYIYIYMYLYMCICVCVKVCICVFSLPLIITPPLLKPPPLGGKHIVYYQFRQRHGYPLIKNSFWFDLPPHNYTLIKTILLGEDIICHYQFRRKHGYPPHKKRCLAKPPPNTTNWWFCC